MLRWLKSTAGLILDPMAGGGVTPDTCFAMGRRCWAFDMMARPDTRPEIEPFTWDISSDKGLLSMQTGGIFKIHRQWMKNIKAAFS
ncbi:MAG: hypothetical protein H8D87_22255 [Deltaproteobacteria bacterium]|uniref:hypothetical protein n=1 Tax=Desulfobacula sp. TaxID=2593537 RepID=UPI00199AFAC6|nr:hypothetical protein [Candidatus Desulfobacula maris]MBL6993850.1 hypothetical protein [Desulfobacula sp.]